MTKEINMNTTPTMQNTDIVTECMYTDRRVWDVIACTAKTLTIRERTAVLDQKAEFEIGGFLASVTKNAVWHTKPKTDGIVKKAHLRKDGRFHTDCGKLIVGDHYFFDYNF
jgi:hypothetical protein